MPLLLNVAANGLSRLVLTWIGCCVGFEITRDETARKQRRLVCVLVLLVCHILLHGLYVSVTLDISFLEATYISYMALSSIGIDWRLRFSHSRLAVVGTFVLVGMGLLTLVAEDALELYQIFKLEQEYSAAERASRRYLALLVCPSRGRRTAATAPGPRRGRRSRGRARRRRKAHAAAAGTTPTPRTSRARASSRRAPTSRRSLRRGLS